MLVRFRCSRGSPVGLSFAHQRLLLLLRPSGHPDGRMRSNSCRTVAPSSDATCVGTFRCVVSPRPSCPDFPQPHVYTAPDLRAARRSPSQCCSCACVERRVERLSRAEPRVRDGCGVYISCGAMRSESRARSGCTKCGQERGRSRSGYAWVPPCLYNWVRRLRRFKTGGLTGRLRRCGTPPARRRTQPAACNLQQTTGLCAAGSAQAAWSALHVASSTLPVAFSGCMLQAAFAPGRWSRAA